MSCLRSVWSYLGLVKKRFTTFLPEVLFILFEKNHGSVFVLIFFNVLHILCEVFMYFFFRYLYCHFIEVASNFLLLLQKSIFSQMNACLIYSYIVFSMYTISWLHSELCFHIYRDHCKNVSYVRLYYIFCIRFYPDIISSLNLHFIWYYTEMCEQIKVKWYFVQ